MVTQGLINLLIAIITPILELFPSIDLPSTSSSFHRVAEFVGGVCYFLPTDTIYELFTLMISFLIIRTIIAFLKTLWAVIPIL